MDEKRGCGVIQKYPIAIIEGKKSLYACPNGASMEVRLLFAFLSAINAGMVAPPQPQDLTIAYLNALRIFSKGIELRLSKLGRNG